MSQSVDDLFVSERKSGATLIENVIKKDLSKYPNLEELRNCVVKFYNTNSNVDKGDYNFPLCIVLGKSKEVIKKELKEYMTELDSFSGLWIDLKFPFLGMYLYGASIVHDANADFRFKIYFEIGDITVS
jgi:hypothetical protein